MLTLVKNAEPADADADLRTRLTDLIPTRNDANKAAREARRIADRADALVSEARAECKRLEEVQQALAKLTNERRGMTIATALREGREPPVPAIPAPAESAAMAAAMANLNAHEVAAADLHREAVQLNEHARQIENEVSRVTREIFKLDVEGLAADIEARFLAYWEARHRLAGAMRADPSILTEERRDKIVRALNHQLYLADKDPRFLEKHYYLDHLDSFATDREHRCRRYLDALSRNAAEDMAKYWNE